MIRVHVFVEGQTEETFVKDVLYDHFCPLDIFLNPILVRTSKIGKGGIQSYGKIRWQVEQKCKEDKQAYVTTMFDVYGLPKDFPGKDEALKIADVINKAQYLEDAFNKDINQKHFIPNFLLHEFEALLFSAPQMFANLFDELSVAKLMSEGKGFPTPEHINDHPQTAPSKRILRYIPAYQKPIDGILIAQAIGLDSIRKECRHFNGWLENLEGLKGIAV